MYDNLSVNELKENSVVTMTFVMFHKGIFYFRDNSFGKSFLLLCDMINEYCGVKLYSYLPHSEEVCLGKFPGNYCSSCFQLQIIYVFLFQMVCGTE